MCIGRIFEDGVTELSDVVSHMTSYDLEILGHHGIPWQNMGDVGQSPLGSRSQALLDGGDVSNKWRRWWGAKKNGTDPKVLDAKDKKVIVIGGRALRIIFMAMAITPMSWDITPFWLGYNPHMDTVKLP